MTSEYSLLESCMRGNAGRYAPSPTGPLHRGSLLAALGSYLQARAQGASWFLRIDDLDTPRVVPGADRRLIETLRQFGFCWDGPVLFQSTRVSVYAQVIRRLKSQGEAFDCGCTRREAQAGPEGIEGSIYPGTCRDGLAPGGQPRSVRLRVRDLEIGCEDRIQGRYRQRLDRDVGDFVIKRADGVAAYQLATVIDDAEQGVTEIVRGADLLSSTPRQIYLGQTLKLPQCEYAHLPVLVDARNRKLGKSTGALALSEEALGAQLWDSLVMLGQSPPESLRNATTTRVLTWAIDNWTIAAVPRVATMQVHDYQRSRPQRSGLAQ